MSRNTAPAEKSAKTTVRTKLRIERRNVQAGVDPYSLVEWGTRDVVLKNWRDGSINFAQYGVEFPTFWSDMQVTIAVSKYFRGAMNTPEREWSLKQVIDRIVDTYQREGVDAGYFKSGEDAQAFADELKFALMMNLFAFNSPVWFNVGTNAPQQVSACYILKLKDDSLEAVLDWYRQEGLVFKGGSGAGINLSKLRSKKELLSSGGRPSGPVSFMRGADASAGTIQSGGATRRAAKMVVLDVDHPDILEFVRTKADEELKIRALRDAGFDMDLGGKDIVSVQYQNANNSVRVTDEFMRAVASDGDFGLTARKDGRVIETVKARELFREIARAAWECADPGLQFVGEIDKMHTLKNHSRISATNPCAEYVHIDDSSCNLASLNLMKFYDGNGQFDVDAFRYMARLAFIAAEISIVFGSFPTEEIGANTKKARPIGLGYANLGAMLMRMGLGYDTDEGRMWGSAVTALLAGVAYETSAELAQAVGPFEFFAANREPMLEVIATHRDSAVGLARTVSAANSAGVGNLVEVAEASEGAWGLAYMNGEEHGFRNSQAVVIAPTGTIGLLMDCDTTGIEPDLALVKYKKLADGTSMTIVNKGVPEALRRLGYSESDVDAISVYVVAEGTIVGAPNFDPKHMPVFQTAMGDGQHPEAEIAPMGHVRMMAAAQPWVSGAISKTINMPESATVEDIENVFLESWKLGLKCQAVYRNNCKAFQPLNVKSKATDSKETEQAETGEPVVKIVEVAKPHRRRLPMRRQSETISFELNGPDGSAEGYLQPGRYEDGDLGELFLRMSKQGSTMNGLMEAFATVTSLALQYGVPLEVLASKLIGTKFAPAGRTNDPEIPFASSPLDYVFRRLALDYLDADTREYLGVYSTEERKAMVDGAAPAPAAPSAPAGAPVPVETPTVVDEHRKSALSGSHDAPLCMSCGGTMRRAGACHVCEGCGSTSGCS